MLRRHFIINTDSGIPNDEIWYTSSNGNVVNPYDTNAFDANIVSNTYEDDKGIIKFDGDVTSIGYNAFLDRSSLSSITIPNSVISIVGNIFLMCNNLTSINVDVNNPNYCSVEDVMFNKDKTTLIGYPGGKQGAYTTPNSVTYIGNGAFRATSLTSLIISNSVIYIGSHGVSYSNLTSITIGNSVMSIDDYFIDNCRNLINISYEGTIAQWNTIAKSNNWKGNNTLTVVHCIDGDVEI